MRESFLESDIYHIKQGRNKEKISFFVILILFQSRNLFLNAFVQIIRLLYLLLSLSLTLRTFRSSTPPHLCRNC